MNISSLMGNYFPSTGTDPKRFNTLNICSSVSPFVPNTFDFWYDDHPNDPSISATMYNVDLVYTANTRTAWPLMRQPPYRGASVWIRQSQSPENS